jgi:hypothetical protein
MCFFSFFFFFFFFSHSLTKDRYTTTEEGFIYDGCYYGLPAWETDFSFFENENDQINV